MTSIRPYHALGDRDELIYFVGRTLLRLTIGELQSRGERTVFLSLDFEYDRPYFSSQQSLIKKLELEIGINKGFVFIDEIQKKENAGLFLKGIQDLDLPYKLIVSGSGSVDLKARVKESMVGRKKVYELYPVSLKEFVNFKTDYQYENKLVDFFSVEGLRLDSILSEYLHFGGYPNDTALSATGC